MPALPIARLRAVTGVEQAAELFRELGFLAEAVSVRAAELGLGDFPVNRVLKKGASKRKGFAVFIAETGERPRTLRPLARRLQQNLHDRPLGVVGQRGPDGAWQRFTVFRPQLVPGTIGATRVSRLEVDIRSPTRHDAEVLGALRWNESDDAKAHAELDEVLDVERVTKRFFTALNAHFANLRVAIEQVADEHLPVLEGVKNGGGAERVALRIITQILFCWFLQRKDLLGNRPDYLHDRFRRHKGRFYETELEPLFYEALGTPVDRRTAGAPGPEVPFLNGGLFHRPYGDVSLPLDDSLFDTDDGLLGFLGGWTFTIAEDTPEEMEVAVDPEMLGKVFENLISDDEVKRQGTVYTPRPVVHFMCREALVPRLQERLGVDERTARLLLVSEDPLTDYKGEHGAAKTADLCRALDTSLEAMRLLDPAVGSGAFLLGMLAEVVRLRTLVYEAQHEKPPSPEDVLKWKLHAVEHNLFGIDIEPTAIELCRLRLWLSLVVDLPQGITPDPLPNLEHRTVVADSLTDFVNAIEIQHTRGGGVHRLDVGRIDVDELVALRGRYFQASDPDEKADLGSRIATLEDELIAAVFDKVSKSPKTDPALLVQVEELRSRFNSPDRVFPAFVPEFHAPEVWRAGGWDIAIMNPPYVGHKEIPRRLSQLKCNDYEQHYGQKSDLMVLFAHRALQLTHDTGIVSMIFNDSIFTSSDAEALRRTMLDAHSVLTVARTKCFEGKAVNGGVIVLRKGASAPPEPLRWVEGYKKPPVDFASASDPLKSSGKAGRIDRAGAMEVFSAPGIEYARLPHRPLFRPSAEAISLIERFTACERWADLSKPDGWSIMSNTRALERQIRELRDTGWYDRLEPGHWVLLGFVVEGGQGLATGDDKHFLAAIEATEAAAEHLANQEYLERLVLAKPAFKSIYEKLRAEGKSREEALLALWDDPANEPELEWPKGKTFRVAPRRLVRDELPTEKERQSGIAKGPFFVPFEKGDQSQKEEDAEGTMRRLGARWCRQNDLVIDWSRDAVTLLRARAAAGGARSPRFQNEDLWFTEGIVYNTVASYLRTRLAPPSVLSHKAPFLRPSVDWLDARGLMAMLNSDTLDFIVRALLGSRNMIEVGDIRHIPVPVLDASQSARFSSLGKKAVEFKQSADAGGNGEPLRRIEAEINAFVRDLYGVARDVELWVVR